MLHTVNYKAAAEKPVTRVLRVRLREIKRLNCCRVALDLVLEKRGVVLRVDAGRVGQWPAGTDRGDFGFGEESDQWAKRGTNR